MARPRSRHAKPQALSHWNVLWQQPHHWMGKHTNAKIVHNSRAAPTRTSSTTAAGTSFTPPHIVHSWGEKWHCRRGVASLLVRRAKNLTATHPYLAHHFNLHLTLSHKHHWKECRLENVTTTDVISDMLGWQSHNGVVDANNATGQKYWHHWCAYIKPLHINPFLETTTAWEVILETITFIDRVRRGYYRNGKRIIFQTPQVALSAISQTIELEGCISPIYIREKNYMISIQRQIEGYQREEPLPTHKLAVPVSTVNPT